MKKTFQLKEAGNDDLRVVEAIKGQIRKYLKRERRKPVPVGVDFWDFDCQVGPDAANRQPKHPAEVIDAVAAVSLLPGATTVYVEILAKPGHRQKKPDTVPPAPDAGPVG